MRMNGVNWEDEFRNEQAFWSHSGDVEREPFVRVSCGEITSEYFLSRRIQQQPTLLMRAAKALIEQPEFSLYQALCERERRPITRVVGAETSGIALASYIALLLEVPTSFAERDGDMYVFKGGFNFSDNEHVVIADDTITSGRTLFGMIEAVQRDVPDASIAPLMLVLCNRSNRSGAGAHSIIALVDREFPRWCEGQNPHTPDGRELHPPIRPKTAETGWERNSRMPGT
jgi:orotate phosphoribosyltransferase